MEKVCETETYNDVLKIDQMLDYYLNHPDSNIYKKTPCLCHGNINFCIINNSPDKYDENYSSTIYKK